MMVCVHAGIEWVVVVMMMVCAHAGIEWRVVMVMVCAHAGIEWVVVTGSELGPADTPAGVGLFEQLDLAWVELFAGCYLKEF